MPENREKTRNVAKRNATSFKPGHTGNPGGRPKKSPEMRRIEDLAKQHSEAALAALLDEARTGRGAPRVAAAIAILDRGWGRPVERKESGDPGAFTDEADLERSIRERLVKLGLVRVVPIKDVTGT